MDFWGAEPTLNASYFKDFTIELLEFFPNIRELMFSTNAKVGGKVIYDYFIDPIRQYCDDHNRKIGFSLQISLDGPTEMNDEHRYPGATEKILDAINYLVQNYPKEYTKMQLHIFTKATVSDEYYKKMVEDDNFLYHYYSFLDNVYVKAMILKENNNNITFEPGVPTIVNPGNHTIEDGKIFAKWIHKIMALDTSKFKFFNNKALFAQPLRNIKWMMEVPNLFVEGRNFMTCSTGRNNVVVDHKGNFYNCHVFGSMTFLDHSQEAEKFASTIDITKSKDYIGRRLASSQFHDGLIARKHFFDSLVFAMAKAGQIDNIFAEDESMRLWLFYLISHLWCPASALQEYTHNYYILPTSYLKLLGNGAAQALFDYYNYERERGSFSTWRIIR